MAKHLVIQGPMCSLFSSYCRLVPGPDVVERDGKAAYDCSANVLRLARDYRESFDEIILSTWDNERLVHRGELESLGVRVVALNANDVACYKNSTKQIIGVVAGLDAIPNVQDDDKIVKTRTDLSFDINQFVQHVDRADGEHRDWESAGQLGLIHAPSSMGPFYLQDLFVCARARDFRRFWEACLPRNRVFAHNIHRTCAIEYPFRHRRELGLDDELFRDYYRWVSPIHRGDSQIRRPRLWRELLRKSFCFAPAMDPDQFLWRGAPSAMQCNARRMTRMHMFNEWLLIRENEGAVYEMIDYEYLSLSRPTRPARIAYSLRESLATRLHVGGWERLAAIYERWSGWGRKLRG